MLPILTENVCPAETEYSLNATAPPEFPPGPPLALTEPKAPPLPGPPPDIKKQQVLKSQMGQYKFQTSKKFVIKNKEFLQLMKL